MSGIISANEGAVTGEMTPFGRVGLVEKGQNMELTTTSTRSTSVLETF